MKLIMENWRKFVNEACWDGYTQRGMKMKNGKRVPNCVPMEEAIDSSFDGEMDALRGIRPGRDMMSDPSYSSGYSSMSPGQKKINAETLYPMLKKLANREDFDPKIKSGINDLFRKTVNTIRDKGEGPILSDQELQGLLDASRNSKSIDPNSPNSFAGQVLAMLDGMQSDVDTDNDGIPDEKELAIIDRGEIPNI